MSASDYFTSRSWYMRISYGLAYLCTIASFLPETTFSPFVYFIARIQSRRFSLTNVKYRISKKWTHYFLSSDATAEADARWPWIRPSSAEILARKRTSTSRFISPAPRNRPLRRPRGRFRPGSWKTAPTAFGPRGITTTTTRPPRRPIRPRRLRRWKPRLRRRRNRPLLNNRHLRHLRDADIIRAETGETGDPFWSPNRLRRRLRHRFEFPSRRRPENRRRRRPRFPLHHRRV